MICCPTCKKEYEIDISKDSGSFLCSNCRTRINPMSKGLQKSNVFQERPIYNVANNSNIKKIEVACPSCKNSYKVFEYPDYFYCTTCQLKVRFKPNGDSEVYRESEPVKTFADQNSKLSAQPSQSKSSKSTQQTNNFERKQYNAEMVKLVVIACILFAVSYLYVNYQGKFFSLFKTKPYLELSGNSSHRLNISEFVWGYGMTEINQFNGDFDKLDEKVYDLLKGKSGTSSVYIEAKVVDKYGNSNSTMNYVGDINIDELNKYQDWQVWHNDAGIRTIIYKNVINHK